MIGTTRSGRPDRRVRWALAGVILLGAVASGLATGSRPALAGTPAHREDGGSGSLSAAFDPAMVPPGEPSDLVLTVTETSGSDVEGLAYTVALPAHVSLVGTGTDWYSDGCHATTLSTATANGITSVTLAGGWAYGHEDCTTTLHVTSDTPGVHPVGSGAFSGLSGNLEAAGVSASLTVDPRPSVSPFFHDASIPAPGGTLLTLILAREDEDPDYVTSGLSYRITLPDALAVGTDAIPTGNGYCDGTVTATPGGHTITLGPTDLPSPGLKFPSGPRCAVQVPVVTSTGGVYTATDFPFESLAGDLTLDSTRDITCNTQQMCGSRTLTATPKATDPPTLTGGVSSVTASWAAPDGLTGITGYTVTADPGPSTCTTDGATSCVLGGTAGVAYTVTVVAHTDGRDSGPSEASNEATPSAPVPPATPPSTNLTMTTDKGKITTAVPGQDITFLGTGFAAFSTVVITIYSGPAVLGTAVTDANGNFAAPVTVPPDLSTGGHTALAQGVAPDGTSRAMKLAITVPGGGSGQPLPVTGTPLWSLADLGLALLVAGTGLLVAIRRRRGRAADRTPAA